MLRVAVACSWPFGCSVLNTVPSGASGPVLCRVVMVWPLFRVLSLHRTVQWYSTVPSGARLFLWFSVWPGALPVIHTIQSGAPPPDRPVCYSTRTRYDRCIFHCQYRPMLGPDHPMLEHRTVRCVYSHRVLSLQLRGFLYSPYRPVGLHRTVCCMKNPAH